MQTTDGRDAGPMRAEVVDARGEGPALVYVPGIDGSGELLLGTAARLARRFRLVRLRYAGSLGGYPTLASSVAERIAEAAGASGGRALVLAESFGVAVALQTALDHPGRVAGLALVNGFAHYTDRFGLALARGLFAVAPRAWVRRARAGFAQRGLFAPRRDEQALRALVALDGDWFDAGYRARLAWIRGLDLRPRLPDVRCPVALFAADHDRVVRALPAAREMERGIAGAELTTIRAAGHVVLPLADEPWEERLARLAARAGLARDAGG